MIKEAITTAATRDEAIEKAKAALNAPIDADVKYEILQDAKKGFLGIGGKEARVRAYYEAPDKAPAKAPVNAPAKAPVKTPAKTPAKAPAKAPFESKQKKAVQEKKDAVSAPAEPMSEKDDTAIRTYITAIIKGMGVEDVKLSASTEGEETIYEILTEENHGAIIGRHGETLDSVQYLVRLFANKNTDGRCKVSINVGDYREKRAESLKTLAARSASQVLKYGRNAKLEPMNPYERRIVHTAVQGIEGVTSHSVGFDSERRVIITLEEGVQPTHGDKRRSGGYNGNRGGNRGGYNNNRGGNRGGYNNNNRGGNREGYKPNVAADRAPKSDTAGSRYGKIEIAKKDENKD